MFGIAQDPLQRLHIQTLQGKDNSSSFHFTAHQKLLIFFFIGFIFQSSASSCGHLSSLLFGDDQLINYSFCIDDFCLHLFQLFPLTFLCNRMFATAGHK